MGDCISGDGRMISLFTIVHTKSFQLWPPRSQFHKLCVHDHTRVFNAGPLPCWSRRCSREAPFSEIVSPLLEKKMVARVHRCMR